MAVCILSAGRAQLHGPNVMNYCGQSRRTVQRTCETTGKHLEWAVVTKGESKAACPNDRNGTDANVTWGVEYIREECVRFSMIINNDPALLPF